MTPKIGEYAFSSARFFTSSAATWFTVFLVLSLSRQFTLYRPVFSVL
jgi:hypothetical protein